MPHTDLAIQARQLELSEQDLARLNRKLESEHFRDQLIATHPTSIKSRAHPRRARKSRRKPDPVLAACVIIAILDAILILLLRFS